MAVTGDGDSIFFVAAWTDAGVTTWLRWRVWPRVVEEVPGLDLAGCRREADRTGRGGGGMSVFFGDVGRPFCLVVRLGFTGEGGPRAAVVGVVEGAVSFVAVVDFNGLGRTKLCRRAAIVEADEGGCSDGREIF